MEYVRARVGEMPSTDASALLGELERVKALAWMRVQTPRPTSPTPSLDRYLTAAEVAERLGVKLPWVYSHRDDLGGVKMAGVVRYPERAIIRYLAGR